MVGRADLYIAFFEAALRQLKAGGVCAFVCADRWMLNHYGAERRRFITASCAVETVVEMHKREEPTLAQCCVIVAGGPGRPREGGQFRRAGGPYAHTLWVSNSRSMAR
jgi:hypothetical protein